MNSGFEYKTLMLYRWIRLQQSGIRIENLFCIKGYKRIALYGYNEISRCLLYELDNSDVNICCIIDEKGSNLQINMDCIVPEEVRNIDVDVIVITYANPTAIIDKLKELANCPVVAFDEIIYEL